MWFHIIKPLAGMLIECTPCLLSFRDITWVAPFLFYFQTFIHSSFSPWYKYFICRRWLSRIFRVYYTWEDRQFPSSPPPHLLHFPRRRTFAHTSFCFAERVFSNLNLQFIVLTEFYSIKNLQLWYTVRQCVVVWPIDSRACASLYIFLFIGRSRNYIDKECCIAL